MPATWARLNSGSAAAWAASCRGQGRPRSRPTSACVGPANFDFATSAQRDGAPMVDGCRSI
ncbi:MAG: pyridoxamine 5'-phosphate oxidase family protein [Pelomonas sp.]|nr:pyridoxamine 5'-phosphate oxidase family protein [Roseateles sp.]